MKHTILPLVIFFLPIFESSGFVNAQTTNEDGMKITVEKLIKAFLNNDSAQAMNLFENEKYKKERVDYIGKDSKFFQLVTKKYGVPSIDKMERFKDSRSANLIVINLMNQDDSLLKIKRCDLVVTFYPDQFLVNPDKFLYYNLSKQLLFPTKIEPLKRPIVTEKKSN